MRTLLLETFDLTPKGKIVPCAKIGEKGYGENVEYTLIFYQTENAISMEWYGDDDTFISLEEYLDML
jgi:hypothetical protein